MAAAIKKIYPEVKFAIGPSIKNGFYYDFEIDGNISPEDIPAIEKQMKKLIGGNHIFQRNIVSKKEVTTDDKTETSSVIINESDLTTSTDVAKIMAALKKIG